MSERIDVRADMTIAGGAVHGERTALTRGVAAGPAAPVPAGGGVPCAAGYAGEVAANRGDPLPIRGKLCPLALVPGNHRDPVAGHFPAALEKALIAVLPASSCGTAVAALPPAIAVPATA